MAYQPIDINYEDLTIMGVSFPDLETLESAANAIGSNMFEGFVPTQGLIQFYRDWRAGKISDNDFLAKLKEKCRVCCYTMEAIQRSQSRNY